MRRIRKYIACALSAAMVMSSAFVQGAVVSHAEEQDVGIVATAGDAEEADGVQAEDVCVKADIELQNEELETEKLDAQGESVESVDTETGLKYKVTDDVITITGYSGTAAKVEIPSEIDGKTVISIGAEAFLRCSSLTSISIPDSVTSIGNSAFSLCSSLTNISIPDSVTSIGESAFANCSSLTSISIPDSVTSIGATTFWYCSSMTSITLSKSLTSIGSSAFYNCSRLVSIDIPNSVVSIGSGSFSGCSSLTSINLSKKLTSIGDSTFVGCSKLTSISIPEAVISIGKYAFSDCSSLVSIKLPNSVTSIGDYAFSGCSRLTSIIISEGVISIGAHAFSDCSKLTNISIPDSVVAIGDYVFSGCKSLASIDISENITSIGDAVFDGCSSLANVIIPDGVVSIGDRAFFSCSGLTSISIPESVVSIGNEAFFYCIRLNSIEISSNVISIGDRAFQDCSNLNIICKMDSTAYTYAVDNSISYRIIGQLVTGITLDDSSKTLYKGNSVILVPSVTPVYAMNTDVSWDSSNPNVATVDTTGKVTAIAEGTTQITCIAADESGETASCEITVIQPVTNIALNSTSKTLAKGKSVTLKAIVTLSNATNKDVTWTSNKTSVATVSDKGVVKAVGVGTATITCTAADGSGKKASCTITVKTPVTKVALNASSKTIAKGKSTTLKATVTPAKAYQKVTWKSSNESVATVTASGKVTAKKVGTATITCTAADGSGKKVTCKITVKTPVTKIKLSKTSASIKTGKTLTLKATVTPTKAYQKVTWKSSNTKVATVSSSGKVTAKKKGTATITCTAADGSGKKVTCKITVK